MLSIVIHLLFGGVFWPLLRQVRAVLPHPKATAPPVVGLSDIVTIEKRKVVPRPHPNPQPVPARPQHPSAAVVRARPSLPRPPVRVAEPRNEVAPPAPRAERQEIVANKTVPRAARSAPRHEGIEKATKGETQVALAEPRPRTPSSHEQPFTQQELAAMQRQFAQTIAQARQREDPMNVPTEPPAGQKAYKIQIQGIYGDLRRGEGILRPTRRWSQDGYDYYYVDYEVVFTDGTYDSGSVPWPIRYRPREDPFLQAPHPFPLPSPLPGFELPPNTELGPALRPYFPDRYPSDANNQE